MTTIIHPSSHLIGYEVRAFRCVSYRKHNEVCCLGECFAIIMGVVSKRNDLIQLGNTFATNRIIVFSTECPI